VKFQSYFNELPVMLIGSSHAFAIESVKGLIEGGQGNPVALETKLGVTVYVKQISYVNPNVNLTIRAFGHKYRSIMDLPDGDTITNEELSDLLTYFYSIESLRVSSCESRPTESGFWK
jgi:hypothetical protein